jgi:hypothetical protein
MHDTPGDLSARRYFESRKEKLGNGSAVCLRNTKLRCRFSLLRQEQIALGDFVINVVDLSQLILSQNAALPQIT